MLNYIYDALFKLFVIFRKNACIILYYTFTMKFKQVLNW